VRPLENFTIKFGRAQEHAQQLSTAVANGYTVTTDADLNPDATAEFRWIAGEGVPKIPPEWLGIMGDAIHNYRATLDHMMWSLTLFDGGTTGRWTQFPVLETDSWDDRGNSRERKSLRQLSPSRQEMVKDLQPYNGWNGPGEHPLLRLHNLDIIDKHRHFNAVLHLPLTTEFQVKEARDCELTDLDPVGLGKRLEPQTVIATWQCRITGPNPHIQVEAQFATQIEFEDGLDVLETLAVIASYFRTDVSRLLPDEIKMTLAPPAA
jgi:hypothetical protein